MLKLRLLSVTILLPLVLSLLLFSPTWGLQIFFLTCLSITVFEALVMLVPVFNIEDDIVSFKREENISFPKMKDLDKRYTALGLGMSWVLYLVGTILPTTNILGLLGLSINFALFIAIVISPNLKIGVSKAMLIVFSYMYAGLPWVMLYKLSESAPNSRFVLLVLAITWGGDTGAYFSGRLLGNKIFKNKKLAPQISPNKTWEGAIGGVLMAIIFALLLNIAFDKALGAHTKMISIAFFGCIAAVIGDLLESSLKRFANVKDSGWIIPGHGGFLDRVDALLVSTPVIWFLL